MSFSNGFSTMSSEEAKSIQKGIHEMSKKVQTLAKENKKAAIFLLKESGVLITKDKKTGRLKVSVKLLSEKVHK